MNTKPATRTAHWYDLVIGPEIYAVADVRDDTPGNNIALMSRPTLSPYGNFSLNIGVISLLLGLLVTIGVCIQACFTDISTYSFFAGPVLMVLGKIIIDMIQKAQHDAAHDLSPTTLQQFTVADTEFALEVINDVDKKSLRQFAELPEDERTRLINIVNRNYYECRNQKYATLNMLQETIEKELG